MEISLASVLPVEPNRRQVETEEKSVQPMARGPAAFWLGGPTLRVPTFRLKMLALPATTLCPAEGLLENVVRVMVKDGQYRIPLQGRQAEWESE